MSKSFHPLTTVILRTFLVLSPSIKFNVPLIFYGEAPAEYGDNVEWNEYKFNLDDKPTGYQLDPLEGKNFKDA